jgi:hypothetical protein
MHFWVARALREPLYGARSQGCLAPRERPQQAAFGADASRRVGLLRLVAGYPGCSLRN